MTIRRGQVLRLKRRMMMKIPNKNNKIKIVLLDPEEEGEIKSNDKEDDENNDAKPAITTDEFVILELEDAEDNINDEDAKD